MPVRPVRMELEPFFIQQRRSARRGRRSSLRVQLGRYLLGPSVPDDRPLSRCDDFILAGLRENRGAVVPADVMRLTGLSRSESERVLCRLVARHGGDLTVREPGAVVYQLPFARSPASRPLSPPAPVWVRVQVPPPVTGNHQLFDLGLALLSTTLLLVSAFVFVRGLRSDSWLPLLALLPFGLTLIALALPLSRFVGSHAVHRRIADENGRRRILKLVLEERSPGAVVSAYDLSHAWIAASGHPISSETLIAELRSIGGEPDVTAEGRLVFRFPDLDYEAAARAAG